MLKFIKFVIITTVSAFVLLVAALAITIGYTEHQMDEAIESCEMADGTVSNACMTDHLTK